MASTRRVHLPIASVNIRALGPDATWGIFGTVPATRAGCPDTAFCGHVRCRYNLARIDSCDRAGRPGLQRIAKGAHGWTVRVLGHLGNEKAPTTLRAWWLAKELPTSLCALDLAERAQTNDEIASALGIHRTLSGRLVRGALRKFIANGGDLEMLRAARGPES